MRRWTAKTCIVFIVLMGMLLSVGKVGAVPGERFLDPHAVDCSGSAPCDEDDEDDEGDEAEERHDNDCPAMPHHHHNDGCACVSAPGAHLAAWETTSLRAPVAPAGGYESRDEFPPEAPIFPLDKPPLI